MMFRFFLYFFIATKFVRSADTNLLNGENSSNCGGEYSGYNYQLISPNYPRNYPDNIDCIYILRGSHLADCNQIFHLHFLDFSLRPSEDCSEDFVEIGDSSSFCGNVGGIRRYSGKDNALRIRFHSTKINGAGRGFNISVTTLPCPTSDQKNLTSSPLSERNSDKNDGNTTPEVESITEVSEDDTESLHAGYNNLYPIYRPQPQFTIEEGTKSTEERIGIDNVNNLTYNTRSLDDKVSKKLEVVAGKSVRSDLSKPAKISAYFFASPDPQIFPNPTDSLSELSLPLNYRSLPFKSSEQFSSPSQRASPTENQLSRLEATKILNQKIGIPASSYGTPDIISYSPIHEIKTGEVLENTREIVDCIGKANINEGQVISLENNYPPSAFDPPTSYPALTYGQPGSSFTYTQSPSFPRPPTQYLPSPSRPIDFVPSLNPGNYFPTISKNSGQCCSSLYSSQRFLLSSPGFPSLIYSGNPYQCTYAIAPYSPNICRLRLNFKFFNFGTEDQFCSNGHLEIDGRRYCGCRTGLSIVSSVPNLFTKIIGVRYIGLPRTKLNGFLVEVVQESCSYNTYPYLSRSKKNVGNATVGEAEEVFEENASRVKRDLGYSYPKPDIPFDAGGENSGRTLGIGHSGFSSATKCQTFSLIDWTLAAKETYLRNGRCTPENGNGGALIPNRPNYPGSGNGYPTYPGNGNGFPGHPGNGYPIYPGSGNGLPGYPGNGNNLPGYPGGGNGIPNYPPNNGYPGNTFPGYPGTGQPGYAPPGNGIPSFSGSCETVAVTEGIISSQFYPSPYPNNADQCWRFYRAPVTCRLQLSFLDFDVEASSGCVKDYVAISNQSTRYCGRTLAGSKTHLGFPTNNVIDVRFISDNFGTGKGFSIAFAQIPCQVEVNR